MTDEKAMKAAEDAVIDAMIEHGPDGHIDGFEEIARAAVNAYLAALSNVSEIPTGSVGQADTSAHAAAVQAENANAWDEGYWRGINGYTGPGNPYRDSGERTPA